MTDTADPIAAARALLEELDDPAHISTFGYLQVTRKLKAMVATLADALEVERAKVAAAYEAAARDCARQADQVANAAITGIPEQARQRESMEAAFTKAA